MGKQRRKPVELRFPEVSPAAASQRERATLLRELGDALGEEGNDPALGGSPEGSSIRAQLGDEQDAHEQAGAMESPLTSVTWNPMFQPNTHTNKAPPPSARALRAANRAVGGPLAVRHHATSKQRADAILKRIDRLQAQEQVGTASVFLFDSQVRVNPKGYKKGDAQTSSLGFTVFAVKSFHHTVLGLSDHLYTPCIAKTPFVGGEVSRSGPAT
jgi:hypothetical protein